MNQHNIINKKTCLIVAGPTGVGKTSFVEDLVGNIKKIYDKDADIINADVGQFYKDLNIGVAKPEVIISGRDYLFNILDIPQDINVTLYRKLVIQKVFESFDKNKLPIIVGGSGFYLRSLFFPPIEAETGQILNDPKIVDLDFNSASTQQLWENLFKIDAQRALKIPKGDRYRIERALTIFKKTGLTPSHFNPKFDLPFNFKLLYLTRDRSQLYEIINKRTIAMFNSGWVEEVKNLNNEWHEFLNRKKIIGYPEIIDFLKENKKQPDIENLISIIQQKTRNYAKRQETFFRKLVKDLNGESHASSVEINLTLSPVDLYIEELIEKFVAGLQK